MRIFSKLLVLLAVAAVASAQQNPIKNLRIEGHATIEAGATFDATGGTLIGFPGIGTVVSVNASGGTTGLSFSGGPITGTGLLTLTGVLSVANGGTGMTTPSLIAGSNVAITGSWPNQTISATSGGGVWGSVTGNIVNQTDLQTALSLKQNALNLSGSGLIKFTSPSTYTPAVAGTDYLVNNQSITLSGDASGSGATGIAVVNAKVNGVAYPASPSTNTLPVVTGANTVTYETVPNAALANSAVTLAGNNVSLGGNLTLDQLTGLNATGLVKRSGLNTFVIAAPGTDYQAAGSYVTTARNVNTTSPLAGGGALGGDLTLGFTSTTNRGLVNDVWIAVRTDAVTGTGSKEDPFDGSSQTKFEQILSNIPAGNYVIHLGPTDPAHPFSVHEHDTVAASVKAGWTIMGEGEGKTTVQLNDNLAGIHFAVGIFTSSYNTPADGVTIRDLTVDGNFIGVADSIDDGTTGPNSPRTVTDGVTINNSATIKSATAAFRVSDIKCKISGTGIVASPVTRIVRIPTTRIASGSDAVTLFTPLTSVSTTVSTSLFTKTTHGLVNGEPVVPTGLSSTTGLTNGTIYYVVSASANTFKLSATLGGSAVTMGGTNDAGVTISYPSTLHADDTTDFATTGTLLVESDAGGFQAVAYTGKTSNTFTGCTGGIGLLHVQKRISTNSQVVMSQAATAGASSVSVTVGGRKMISINGVGVGGSHINIEHVTAINCYGSTDTTGGLAHESFPISTGSTGQGSGIDGTDDHIRFCRIESQYGDYGNAFTIGGTDAWHPLTGSSIENCVATGVDDGRADSGLNNSCTNTNWVKNLRVAFNQCRDTGPLMYCDTGSQENTLIIGNTTLRTEGGVELVQTGDPSWTNANVQVIDNYFDLLSRVVGSGDSANGIRLTSVGNTGMKVEGNTFYQHAGNGAAFGGGAGHRVHADSTVNLTLRNNRWGVDSNFFANSDFPSATGTVKQGNRDFAGQDLPLNGGDGLYDTEPTVGRHRITKFGTGSSASIRFGDVAGEIPVSGYNDLIITFNGKSDENSIATENQFYVTFNDDSGPYAYHVTQSYGNTTPTVVRQSNSGSGAMLLFSIVSSKSTGTTAGEGTSGVIEICNYPSSGLHKNVVGHAAWQSGTLNAAVLETVAGMWKRANVLPITSVQCNLDAGHWTTTSEFNLEAR